MSRFPVLICTGIKTTQETSNGSIGGISRAIVEKKEAMTTTAGPFIQMQIKKYLRLAEIKWVKTGAPGVKPM